MPSDVTVIVATYERPDWLRIAVESILASAAETARDGSRTRIVVADDASPTSGTRDVAARLGVDYVRVPQRSSRRDPATARQLGLGLVDTEFFCFFDDDDAMLSQHLPLHLRALREGADVAYSSYLFADEELKPYRRLVPMKATLGMLLAGHNPVNDHALQRTATCVSAWDASLEKAAPFGAWIELLFRGASFVRVTTPTYLYRRHGANMSGAPDARFAQLRAELEDRYRRKAIERDGRVPAAPLAYRARELLAAPARRALGALGRR